MDGMGNIRTGEINDLEHFTRNMSAEERAQFLTPVDPETLNPFARMALEKTGRAKIGRNDACLCGSGKKFKRCCMVLPQPVEPSLIVRPW
jgi:uncharacterized protein YecA (UPF0149 family)